MSIKFLQADNIYWKNKYCNITLYRLGYCYFKQTVLFQKEHLKVLLFCFGQQKISKYLFFMNWFKAFLITTMEVNHYLAF